MKKDLYIFIGIFLFLSIGMHFEKWVSDPIAHIRALPEAGAYGIGAVHPLVFTLVVYIIFVLIRGIYRVVKQLVSK